MGLKQKIYNNYINAERILVKITVDAVEDIFIKTLKHKHLGYGNIKQRALLDHLFTTYATINQLDLEENKEKMTIPYVVTQPIETLYKQITTGVSFAALGTLLLPQDKLWTWRFWHWQRQGCS